MKKIVLYVALPLLLFASCNDLDLEPLNSLDKEQFFRTDEDVILAVNGVYAALVESESVVIGWCVDLGSDYAQNGESMPDGSGAELGAIKFNAANWHTNWAWGDTYYGVANATTLINKLDNPATTVTDRIKKRVRGEAKFLRANYHFTLVQLFGEIPVIIADDNDAGVGVERDDVQVVYQQIVQDLKDAAEDLSEYPTTDAYGQDDKGRVTQQSAYGLLAKVYLVWAQTNGTLDVTAKYNEAVKAANLVTGYSLEQKYHANWEKDNRYGKEVLFAANYVISQESFGDGGNHLTHCAFQTGFEQQTPHVIVSDRTFFDRFDGRDQRKLATFLTKATNPDNGLTTIYNLPRYAKYVDLDAPATSSKNRELNATILRYSDVLLVKAEAINERDQAPNTEAYEAINKVRRRAYKVGEFADGTATATLGEVELKDLNYLSFRKALRRERLYELTYEQQRWFDLTRWKVLVKTVKRVSAANKKDNVANKHYRFPIPQAQRDLNKKLWQNWGYEGSVAPEPLYAAADYEGGSDNNDGWTEEEIADLYSHISSPE
ncbi:RagB/SusD family nutrient uptake outer membrane protein [termite gut metagenome]|uniref:RagB/SusD family nutrient uptake outer membrane protein n=1 Tax=termite gut metagenome TaxID=433724 RepID=A0A5J4SVW6_9ZZZZ